MPDSGKLKRLGFDYRDFGNSDGQRLKELANRAALDRVEMAKRMVQMGGHLSEAKKVMESAGSGKCFAAWVESEVGISKSAAYRCMQIHDRFGHLSQGRLVSFSGAALAELSKRQTPSDAVDAALEAAERTSVTATVARRIIRQVTEEVEEDGPGGSCEVNGQVQGERQGGGDVEEESSGSVGEDPQWIANDAAAERARKKIPELVKSLQLHLGNLGLGAEFEECLLGIVKKVSDQK